VSIEDQVARCAVFGKGLSQLLHDPTARRMLRGIEVEDFPPAVADHEETVQDAKSCCWNCEEIHRRNPFPMVPQKRQPELGCVSLTAHSSQAPGDRALRNLKAQLQQLSMDSGGSPGGILLRHALDEVTNLRANLWSTTVPPLGKPTPIEPKSCTMPPDDRLRLHDHQYLGPLGPQSPKRQEEQSIPLTQ